MLALHQAQPVCTCMLVPALVPTAGHRCSGCKWLLWQKQLVQHHHFDTALHNGSKSLPSPVPAQAQAQAQAQAHTAGDHKHFISGAQASIALQALQALPRHSSY